MHLSAIYSFRAFAALAGLMSYALDIGEMSRCSTCDQPSSHRVETGEIPYYQAFKFELIVNLRTARSLGLSISPSLTPAPMRRSNRQSWHTQSCGKCSGRFLCT